MTLGLDKIEREVHTVQGLVARMVEERYVVWGLYINGNTNQCRDEWLEW